MSAIVDVRQLRRAFGKFATGVTIVTCRARDGSMMGVTANSFSSVSLNPPLVSFNIAAQAYSCRAFLDSTHFAIHILSLQQSALSARFAVAGKDKWTGVQVVAGHGGVPLIADCLATFQCECFANYPAGDHYISIGRVLSFDVDTEAHPLLFFGGTYRQLNEDISEPELWRIQTRDASRAMRH